MSKELNLRRYPHLKVCVDSVNRHLCINHSSTRFGKSIGKGCKKWRTNQKKKAMPKGLGAEYVQKYIVTAWNCNCDLLIWMTKEMH